MVTVMRHAYAPLTQHQQQPLALSLCLLTLEQFFFQLKNFKRSLGYKVHPQQMEQHLKGPDLQHLLKADPCNISHAIPSHRQFLPTHCRVPVIGMTKRPRTQQSQCQFGMPQQQRQLSMKLRAKRHFSTLGHRICASQSPGFDKVGRKICKSSYNKTGSSRSRACANAPHRLEYTFEHRTGKIEHVDFICSIIGCEYRLLAPTDVQAQTCTDRTDLGCAVLYIVVCCYRLLCAVRHAALALAHTGSGFLGELQSSICKLLTTY